MERKRPRRSTGRRHALRLASPDDDEDEEEEDKEEEDEEEEDEGGTGSDGEDATAGRSGALGSQVAELARSGRNKLVSSQHRLLPAHDCVANRCDSLHTNTCLPA